MRRQKKVIPESLPENMLIRWARVSPNRWQITQQAESITARTTRDRQQFPQASVLGGSLVSDSWPACDTYTIHIRGQYESRDFEVFSVPGDENFRTRTAAIAEHLGWTATVSMDTIEVYGKWPR